MRSLAAVTLLCSCAFAADNTLTPAEAKAGWKLLFDGRTFRNWRDPAKENIPGDAWAIENGVLKTVLKPRIEEDLISEESFGNFEMKFDWRISPGGNSGVKYRIQRLVFVDNAKIQKGPGGFEGLLGREIAHPQSDRAHLAPGAKGFEYVVGFEFQLLDDARHPDAKAGGTHVTGALYSFLAPSAGTARPAGEWNESLLVVNGSHIEHWINGTKVLDGSLDDQAVAEGAAKRWGAAPEIREALAHPKARGPVSLQHHGDEVWFKNVKIRAR